jgi:hypothetical protein
MTCRPEGLAEGALVREGRVVCHAVGVKWLGVVTVRMLAVLSRRRGGGRADLGAELAIRVRRQICEARSVTGRGRPRIGGNGLLLGVRMHGRRCRRHGRNVCAGLSTTFTDREE